MAILPTSRLSLAALLAALALPASGAEPPTPVSAEQAVSDGGERSETGRSRRVELPFPLDLGSPGDTPPVPASRHDARPHPFRENLPKRA